MTNEQKRRIAEKEKQLADILGLKFVQRIAKPCTGKWAGKNDYGMRFSNGSTLWITMYMQGYEGTLDSKIASYKYFYAEKENQLELLREMSKQDNDLARVKGLKEYEVLDIAINTETPHCDFWAYATIKVGETIIKMVETGMCHALVSPGILQKYVELKRDYFTAGGYEDKDVDFIFHGVGFVSNGGMYRIDATKTKGIYG